MTNYYSSNEVPEDSSTSTEFVDVPSQDNPGSSYTYAAHAVVVEPATAQTSRRWIMGIIILGLVVALATASLLIILGVGSVRYFTGIKSSTSTSAPAPQLGSGEVTKKPLGTDNESPASTLSIKVAEKALPSVVGVSVETVGSGFDPNTGQPMERSSAGSGVIISKDGHILTNNHVIAGGTVLSVSVGPETYDATVVGADPTTDLAVLKIDATGLSAIEIGTSEDLKVGEYVMAVGSPFGLYNSVSTGIVSGLGRSGVIASQSGISPYINLIQTDAAVNPGNSGGALVNDKAQLIGVNTLITSTSGSSAGVGFAIPVDSAISIAQQIISTGKASHPFLGVSSQTVNKQIAGMYGLPISSGAYVVAVTPGSPAEAAGLQRGDIITKIAGAAIANTEDVFREVRTHKVGDTIKIDYQRGKEKLSTEAQLVSDAEFEIPTNNNHPNQ